MRQYLLFLVIIVFIVPIGKTSSAQACSDAGICTINTIIDHSFNIISIVKKRNYFKTGITYGLGEYDVEIINPHVEYSNLLTKKIGISGKLIYSLINGELANTSNLSDLMLTSNYILWVKEDSEASVIAGAKIPLYSSNMTENENPLPMHYQSSLGTYDLIIGVNYVYFHLGVCFALQQPLINSNENEFIAPLDSTLKEFKYQSTNSFERKGDLMNRISFNVPLFNNRFAFRPSIVSIFHLDNDTYIDENDTEHEIKGSQGLTVNGNVFLSYYFSNAKQIELSAGLPIITRDAKPDGLSRKLVVGIEYLYSF